MSDSPYRLIRPAPAGPAVPLLDDAQRAVVGHRDGPLLVLAGPGTGKTTAVVEAVAARVRSGCSPDEILVLTFSRRAAGELRERIAARLGTSTASPAAWTFHAFCYALLRSAQPPERYRDPVRLLSGPEQEVVLRELLTGSAEGAGTARWPEQLRGCLTARGFTEEVRAVFARARELGLEPTDLTQLAKQAARPDWAAVAEFFAEYLDVLDAIGALDYGELVHRAALLAAAPAQRRALRARYSAVFVDEYQDTDPAQEALLLALAGDGRDLTVVGDPDQSIYAFRGADVTGLLEFPSRFPTRAGSPAPVCTLRTSRRAGAALLEVSRRVAARVPLPGLPAAAVVAHRSLQPAADRPPGEVRVQIHPSVGAEAEAIADLLRREHLANGRPWDRMAVLVRSGVRSIPLLSRVLRAAGVPVAVAGDELPLAGEPAVAALLLALRCCDDPAELTPEAARRLLLGPLVAADAPALRRLGRALLVAERTAVEAAGGGAEQVRSSAVLLADAVSDPVELVPVDPAVAAPAERLGTLLRRGREVLGAGGSAEEALWELWSASDWRHRLVAASRRGGPGGGAADRNLDAVVALFATLARSEERQRHRGVGVLLDELQAQQIPAGTLAERTVPGDAVRLLTAHRAKGLEWDLVVVAGVAESVWPDLRRQGSVLEADRIGPDGLREPMSTRALLVEERRLFYVALTRAREALVVTAVGSSEDDGERPSRFLDEIGVEPEVAGQRIARPLNLPALVAALRRSLVDPRASPAMRSAAAARLARLALLAGPAGPLVPSAHPDSWWGLSRYTEGVRPIVAAGMPVRLSGTSLAGLGQCPLRWFLRQQVHAQSAPSPAMGFGGVVHALADDVAKGRAPADLDVLLAAANRVWGLLPYEVGWKAEQERIAAGEALGRFLAWQAAPRERRLVGSEVRFRVELELPSGPVLLTGLMDRVELAGDGRVHVVDFKTTKNPESGPKIEKDRQLGVYQLAVRRGALASAGVAGLPPGPAEAGGAELVQLRKEAGGGLPKVQAQPPLKSDDGGPNWVEEVVDEAVRRILAEEFPPTPFDGCTFCEFRVCCPAQPEGGQVIR